jgi:hypothetical protein
VSVMEDEVRHEAILHRRRDRIIGESP